MKKSIIRMALIFTLVLTLVGLGSFAPQLMAAGPDLTIKGANLTLGDTIYMSFVVPESEGIQLLVRKGSPDAAEVVTLSPSGEMTVGGVPHSLFTFPIAAKEMSVNIYVQAKVDEDLGPMLKYSVLQYVRNKTTAASPDLRLISVLEKMLDYGAAAQEYFGYNTGIPANGDFYEVRVVGGTLSDGTTKGLFLAGGTVTLTAETTNEAGDAFSHWEKGGAFVGDNETLTVTATADATYTAVYAAPIEHTFDVAWNWTGYTAAKATFTCTAEAGHVFTLDGVITNAVTTEATCGTEGVRTYMAKVTYGGNNYTATTTETIPATGKHTLGEEGNLCTVCGEVVFSKGLTYAAVSGGYAVTGIGTCEDTVLLIPQTYNGQPVLSVADNAFQSKYKLTKIVVPEGVTSIGSNAFNNCNKATEIILPSTVTSIGGNAFANCTRLESMTIPSGVQTVGSYFSNCPKLATVVLEEGVTSIGGYAFNGCSGLTSITIPKSVTSIGGYAFNGCSSLTSIIYVGTEAQWNAITKGSNWDSNTGDYTVYFAPNNYYLTTKTRVIENDRFVLTIGEGCYVPLTIEEDYLRIMDEVEKATGLSFDSEYARQRMADREEKRVLISVRPNAEIGWAAQNSAYLCVEGLLEHTGQYMNVAHELTHVINYLNGNMIARVFAEGMTTYTEKVFEDKKIVFYPHCLSDNYIDETLDTMTAENAEALFRAQYEVAYHEQSTYSYGFRMFHFIHENGLYDEYLNMIQYVDTLTWDPEDCGEMEFLPYDLLVAQVKAFLGEDFFEVFGEWHRNNVDRFTTPVNGKSKDMSSCPSFSLFPIGRIASMCYANYEFTYTDQMTIDFSDGIDYAEKAMDKNWLGTLSVEVTYAYYDTTTDATIAFYDADGVLLLSQKIPEPWDTKFTVDGATKVVITGDGKRLRFWPVFEDMFE